MKLMVFTLTTDVGVFVIGYLALWGLTDRPPRVAEVSLYYPRG